MICVFVPPIRPFCVVRTAIMGEFRTTHEDYGNRWKKIRNKSSTMRQVNPTPTLFSKIFTMGKCRLLQGPAALRKTPYYVTLKYCYVICLD